MTEGEFDDGYVKAVACASLVLGTFLADIEASKNPKLLPRWVKRNDDRAKKMSSVNKAKGSAWKAVEESAEPSLDYLAEITHQWPIEERLRFLVDLSFSDPFAPYSLEFDRSDLLEGLSKVATTLGLQPEVVDDIESTRESAIKAHRGSVLIRMGITGLAVAVALGTAGWLAAPAIGTAIGASAGLTGAAATAHGLALLGGGSLAAGGAGMAGGMWLVAGTAASLGLAGGSGSALLLEMGASEARGELVKLQVTFRIAVLGTQANMIKAQDAIKELALREAELNQQLDIERELNDKNASRVKDLGKKLEYLAAAREWMSSEAESVG